MPENLGSSPAREPASDESWRLPPLDGRRARTVLAAYGATALLVLIVVAGSFWFNARDFFGNMPTGAAYGLRTRTNDGIPEIATVARRQFSEPSLREGDRILSIDGKRLADDATEFTISERLEADPDGQVKIRARSTDGTVRSHDIRRVPVTSATLEPSSGMPLWLYVTLGFGSVQLPLLVWLGASLFLAWRRPRDPEAMLLAFGFLLLCISERSGFWLIAFAGLPEVALSIVANIGGSILLLAIAAFPDGRFSNLLSRLAVPMVATLIVLVVAGALAGLPFSVIDVAGLLSIGVVLGSLWWRYRSTADQVQRQQIKWAVFGFCAGLLLLLPMLAASTAGLIPDEGLAPILAYWVIVPLSWLLMPVGLLISLTKYRLYDADAAISRSAGYATLTLLVAALFAASAEALEWLFQASFGRDAGALPNAIAAGLAVVAINPLNNRIQKWAEGRFQKDLVRLRRELPECVADLREISSLDRLLQAILDRVVDGVRAERAAILIGRDVLATKAVAADETLRWIEKVELDSAVDLLDCDRDDPMFPLRVPLRIRHDADGNFGWLLLGPHPDDSFYGRDERETLAELADPIARAIQIVLVREARESEAQRIRSDHEGRLELIEQKMAAAMEAIAALAPRPAKG